jgi:hypothetical protein
MHQQPIVVATSFSCHYFVPARAPVDLVDEVGIVFHLCVGKHPGGGSSLEVVAVQGFGLKVKGLTCGFL